MNFALGTPYSRRGGKGVTEPVIDMHNPTPPDAAELVLHEFEEDPALRHHIEPEKDWHVCPYQVCFKQKRSTVGERDPEMESTEARLRSGPEAKVNCRQ